MNITFLNSDNEEYKGDTGDCSIVYNSLTPFPDVIIDYGCEESYKQKWLIKNRKLIRKVPTINCCAQMSGYNVLKFAESLGVPIPETHCIVPMDLNVNDYEGFVIKEKYMANSGQQYLTTTNLPQKGEYIQKIMTNLSMHVFVFATSTGRTHNVVWKKSNFENTRLTKVALPNISPVYVFAEEEANKLLLHMPDLHFGVFTFLYSKTTQTLNFVKLKYSSLKIVAFRKEMDNTISFLLPKLYGECGRGTLNDYINYLNRG